MKDYQHLAVSNRFQEILETMRADIKPGGDFRATVLSAARDACSFGYIGETLRSGYGSNLPSLFPQARSLDDAGFEHARNFFLLGTIYAERERSHKGGVRLLSRMPEEGRLYFFEQGFLASSHSWSHAFRQKTQEAACLGFVYDDLAHYFMADYPNRLIRRLNSTWEPTDAERSRARQLINRIVERRISKYNAQPFDVTFLDGPAKKRVLVCDQAFGDASAVYGKIDETGFREMLFAAIRENPEADILVKSHPDTYWESGERSGYYSHLAGGGRVHILREPVNPFTLFDAVDTVYVGTSQMGLEALFAGKRVVCFGAPFYAGWGLTDDRQHIPHRRRARTLEDIFHAFYVWYTIYNVPGSETPSSIDAALDYIEAHRPVTPPLAAIATDAPKVSVIVPVYGVEAYIEQCLASLQRQTLREIEIIPVNDASPDRSQAVIDRLATEDPRIRPIRLRKNVGQGFARNEGINVARGEFVWFIDADDFLENTRHLQDLYERAVAEQSDMVRGRKQCEQVESADGSVTGRRFDESEKYFEGDVSDTTLRDAPELLHSRHCWLWLYRRAFLDENCIRFENAQWEERPFVLQALLAAKRLSLSKSRGAVYRVRPDSTARRTPVRRDFDLQLANFVSVADLLRRAGAFDPESDLAPHTRYLLSQSIHYLIVGSPWNFTSDQTGLRKQLLDTIRHELKASGFRPIHFDNSVAALSKMLVKAQSYPLIVAAILANEPDLIETARRRSPVMQKDLYARYAIAPDCEAAADFENALNRYARNERVAGARSWRRVPLCSSAPPRLILHAGATKTGSTYLQSFLDNNRPALIRHGIWVPEVGLFWQPGRPHKQAGHAHFTEAAASRDRFLRDHIRKGLKLMPRDVHTIILSSEAYFLQEKSHQIHAYLGDYPAEAVIYLRRQDEWANSQYCELVSGGAIGRVAETFEDWVRGPKIRSRMDYRVVLDRFASALGKDNVKARVYNRWAFPDHDIVADFAEAVDLPALRALPRPRIPEANDVQLSAPHVTAMREFNRRDFASLEAYLRFVTQATRDIRRWRQERGVPMPPPVMIDNDMRHRLLDKYADINADLARNWLGQPDGRAFDETMPATQTKPPSLAVEELELLERSYSDWAGFDPEAGASRNWSSGMLTGAYRVVNYGMFGWRFWGLTPFVRPHVRKLGTVEDAERFDRDPSGFMHALTSPVYRRQATRLYPISSVMGPGGVFGLWVPILANGARILGGKKYENGLRKNPVLFFRLLRNPIYRGIGRIFFPIGEARPSDTLSSRDRRA